MSRKRVLLVGWDAADWKVITPLMDSGKMPNLQKVVEGGVKGNIATLHPVLSPMLWTSIATGKRPFKHGIYGFSEPTPDGMNIQPISNLSRKTKAVWNILGQNSIRSNVVGWWPSHPAEPISGAMVSDLFFKNSIKQGKAKTLPKGAVHPAELTDQLSDLRFGLEEISMEEIMQLIPRAAEVDQEKDPKLAVCGKMLAETVSIQSIATELMENTDWDFMAVYFDGIDHFSHGFMKYHPPRLPWIDEKEFEIFREVVDRAYIFHDMMLGRLIQLAGEDATVIVVSDHGFHSDHMRPQSVPMDPAGPAIEHRDLGIFAMSGPGVATDQLIFGASLLDVAPTILQLFGLPVGADMDGRVLLDAFENHSVVETIPSWDEVDGDHGQHPEGFQLDPLESEEALKQLVELGYIDQLSPDQKENVDRTVRELEYNLARSYMDAGRYADAVEILGKLFKRNQSEYRIGLQLAICYKALGFHDRLLDLVDHVAIRRVNDAKDSRRKVGELRRLAEERFDEKKTKELIDNDHEFAVPEHLSDKEQRELFKHRSLTNVATYYLDFLRGYAYSAKGNHEQAVISLRRAIDAEPKRTSLHVSMGEVFLKLRKREEAKLSFEKALQIDDNNVAALVGIAKFHNSTKDYESAIEYSLMAVNRMYMMPIAHYTLGYALMKLGRYENAMTAFEVATNQNPNFGIAYRHMAHICWNHTKNAGMAVIFGDLAKRCRAAERENRKNLDHLPSKKDFNLEVIADLGDDKPADSMKPTLRMAPVKSAADVDPSELITVVSGLPRSGTSLMMQMLELGGLELFVDGQRMPDEDNPKGYCEFEKTKSLAVDNSWIGEAKGKVIKVVAPLLENLPAEYAYRVLFMHREVDEIVQSQTKMLERGGKEGANLSDEKLKAVLDYQLEMAAKLLGDKKIPTIRVPYRRVIEDSSGVIEAMKGFLKADLDWDKMVTAIDKGLYRNRAEKTNG